MPAAKKKALAAKKPTAKKPAAKKPAAKKAVVKKAEVKKPAIIDDVETSDGELSEQQKCFAREYIKHFNATRAAIAAGYSRETATQQGSRLLTNVKVTQFVGQLLEARAERTGIDADWLLWRLTEEATADLSDIIDADGKLLPVSAWPEVWRTGLVAGIEVEELFEGRGEDRTHVGNVHKVKLADRSKRLEMIGKHVNVGAFKDRVEHTADGPLAALAKALTGTSLRPREDD